LKLQPNDSLFLFRAVEGRWNDRQELRDGEQQQQQQAKERE